MQLEQTDPTGPGRSASAVSGSVNAAPAASVVPVSSDDTQGPSLSVVSSGVVSFDQIRRTWTTREAEQRLSQTGTVVPTPRRPGIDPSRLLGSGSQKSTTSRNPATGRNPLTARSGVDSPSVQIGVPDTYTTFGGVTHPYTMMQVAVPVHSTLRGLGTGASSLDGVSFSELFAQVIDESLSDLLRLQNLYVIQEEDTHYIALSEDEEPFLELSVEELRSDRALEK